MDANRPLYEGGVQYHTGTEADFFEDSVILLPGAMGRILVLYGMLDGAEKRGNEKRGLMSCRGKWKGKSITAIVNEEEGYETGGSATGMGSASAGIIVDEVVASSGRNGPVAMIRWGSCGSMVPNSQPGDVIIVDEAMGWDATSLLWLPGMRRRLAFMSLALSAWWSPFLKIKADERVVRALIASAEAIMPDHYFVGCEATTGDFRGEQGRPELDGTVPKHLAKRHQRAIERDVACYSMEAAAVFIRLWHKLGRIPCAAVNAVYAQRLTNEFEVKGDEAALEVILNAIPLIHNDPSFGFVH